MTGTTILALDRGKNKSVACASAEIVAGAGDGAITTSRAGAEPLVRATARLW